MRMTNRKTETKLGRRRFLEYLGVLGAARFCLIPVSGINNTEVSDELPILKAGPYLQFSGQDEMTVRWITNVPCYSWVEYGEHSHHLNQKAEEVNDGLVEAYNTNNAITLRGLKPGISYYYRICSKNIEINAYEVIYGKAYVSQIYSFETVNALAGQVSFLVFNDIHDRPESFSHLLQFQAPGRKDFVLLNGDIFNYMKGEDQIVQNLLQPFSGISSGVPLVFSRGNHETLGKFARHMHEYFNCGRHGFYFSFVAGPVYCIVLDSGQYMPDAGLRKFDPYRLVQREWLKQEINKEAFNKAKYKVVFSHIPLFYNDYQYECLHCREVWSDILNEAKIDVHISGHTHVYGIHPRREGVHNYPIVIGGGLQDGSRTIIEVNADDHSFHLKIIDDKGELKGELTI